MKGNFVRAIRNNNPFNIKRSRHAWMGKETRKEGFDPVFEQFSSMELGCRAGLKLLINYVDRGLDTPSKIIQRFAPTTENNTSNYLYFITHNSFGKCILSPDERISDLESLAFLAARIVKFECALTYIEQENFKLSSDDMLHIIAKFNLNKNHVL